MNHARTRPNSRSWTLPQWLALTLAVAIIVLGGVLYGSYSQRWGPPADLAAAAAELALMPRQIGPWNMAEELPIEGSAIEMLECAGYVNRRYIHEDSGTSISVTILVGPPGPIAVHTPEICFSSRDYVIQADRKAVTIKSVGKPASSFWTVDFEPKNPLADSLRVYYAWSRGGPWDASSAPRYKYAATPLLFKLQLAAPIRVGMGDDDGPDPGRQFLEDLGQSGWSFQPTLAPSHPSSAERRAG